MIMLLFITSCNKQPEPYHIIRFYGNVEAMNYSRDLILPISVSDSTHPGALIAKDGDVVIFNETESVYTDFTVDSIYIRTEDGKLFVNGLLKSVIIGNNDTTRNFFDDLLSHDLSNLSMIVFESDIPRNSLDLINKLASVRPDISVGFRGNTTNAETLLKILHPGIILLSPVSESTLTAVSKFSEPRVLIVDYVGSKTNMKVPEIPSMKQLIINSGDTALHSFLASNQQIEHLSVMVSACLDLKEIESLSNLKDLIIKSADSIANPEVLKNMSSLEMLGVSSEYFKFDESLDNLKNLRWINIGSEISQPEFDRLISTHPDLEIVGILGCKKLNITSSLLKLDNLFGLTLYEYPEDSLSLSKLRNLKYLSVPRENIDKNSFYSELKQALPNTVIAANEGFCMGSGWILLILPLVIFIRFFLKGENSNEI
jgi:hypothetical protein